VKTPGFLDAETTDTRLYARFPDVLVL